MSPKIMPFLGRAQQATRDVVNARYPIGRSRLRESADQAGGACDRDSLHHSPRSRFAPGPACLHAAREDGGSDDIPVRRVPEAHLVAVGWDHGHLDTVRRLAQSLDVANAVTFSGPVFGTDRLAAYLDADVFAITPSIFEETSLAALEAGEVGLGEVGARPRAG